MLIGCEGGLQVQTERQLASRAARAAILKGAEVIVCTLISSGGELLNLALSEGIGFDAIIIDEVSHCPC